MNPKKPKVWCEHIKYDIHLGKWETNAVEWNTSKYHNEGTISILVPHSWKLCPICGKRRPKK